MNDIIIILRKIYKTFAPVIMGFFVGILILFSYAFTAITEAIRKKYFDMFKIPYITHNGFLGTKQHFRID